MVDLGFFSQKPHCWELKAELLDSSDITVVSSEKIIKSRTKQENGSGFVI